MVVTGVFDTQEISVGIWVWSVILVMVWIYNLFYVFMHRCKIHKRGRTTAFQQTRAPSLFSIFDFYLIFRSQNKHNLNKTKQFDSVQSLFSLPRLIDGPDLEGNHSAIPSPLNVVFWGLTSAGAIMDNAREVRRESQSNKLQRCCASSFLTADAQCFFLSESLYLCSRATLGHILVSCSKCLI